MLVLYHLAEQRPLMSAFLDAAGIKHENGMIEDDALAPDPAKVRTAATTIASAHPKEDVALYLTTLFWQDPTAWGALAEALEVTTAADR